MGPAAMDHDSDDVILVMETQERGDAIIIAMQGEIDLFTAPRFAEAMQAACSQLSDLTKAKEQSDEGGRGNLVADLQNVSFIDSAGLAVLINLQQKQAHECHLILIIQPGTQPARVLTLAHFERFITIIDSPDKFDLLALTGA